VKTAKVIPIPPLRPDGTCSACVGGWQCEYHQRKGVAKDKEQAETIRKVSSGAKAAAIGRICAALELESDEGGTAEEKAQRRLLNAAEARMFYNIARNPFVILYMTEHNVPYEEASRILEEEAGI
jgi:hypothetical protein